MRRSSTTRFWIIVGNNSSSFFLIPDKTVLVRLGLLSQNWLLYKKKTKQKLKWLTQFFWWGRWVWADFQSAGLRTPSIPFEICRCTWNKTERWRLSVIEEYIWNMKILFLRNWSVKFENQIKLVEGISYKWTSKKKSEIRGDNNKVKLFQ